MEKPTKKASPGSGIWTDKWGRYHDRETDGYNYSSWNGWIFTSYAMAMGLPIDTDGIQECLRLCDRSHSYFLVDRAPEDLNEPLSKDEVAGLATLGILDYELLKKSKYSYYNPLTDTLLRFRFFRAIKALWSLRGKHRKYIFENEVYDAYPVNYRLRWDDRLHVKKIYGDSCNIFEWFFFIVTTIITLLRQDPSDVSRAIVQLEDVFGWDLNRFKLKYTSRHLGDNHLFCQHLRSLGYTYEP